MKSDTQLTLNKKRLKQICACFHIVDIAFKKGVYNPGLLIHAGYEALEKSVHVHHCIRQRSHITS